MALQLLAQHSRTDLPCMRLVVENPPKHKETTAASKEPAPTVAVEERTEGPKPPMVTPAVVELSDAAPPSATAD